MGAQPGPGLVSLTSWTRESLAGLTAPPSPSVTSGRASLTTGTTTSTAPGSGLMGSGTTSPARNRSSMFARNHPGHDTEFKLFDELCFVIVTQIIMYSCEI